MYDMSYETTPPNLRGPKHVSLKVALGGSVAALCLLLMFMTGLIPLGLFTFPAVAGVLLVVIAIEISPRWAALVYAAVALLSPVITPDKEAAMLFIAFFGYYPILKALLERMKSRVLEWACKLLIFNLSFLAGYCVLIFLFNQKEVLESLGNSGTLVVAGMWFLGNIVFVIYDLAITRLISAYVHWFRPKFLRRF